jgi:hypothetical protein
MNEIDRNSLKMQLPPRHQDAMIHNDLIFNVLCLVQLGAFAPWWQKDRNGLNN